MNQKELVSNIDDIVISAVKKELNRNGYDHFEFVSITSIDVPKITSVIVRVGFSEIAMDVDSISGKIIHKERLARWIQKIQADSI